MQESAISTQHLAREPLGPKCQALNAEQCLYRFAAPRTIFFTLRFFEPRAYSRGFSGFSVFTFLRAVRFDFLRSSLLSFFVFAMKCCLFLLKDRPCCCHPERSEGSAVLPVSCLHRTQALSNWAYFSTSFFKPKRGNCTVILASSPSPSRWYTVPSPYLGCRTFCPGLKPFLPLGSSTNVFGTLNFFPRDAKNSAILSMEL